MSFPDNYDEYARLTQDRDWKGVFTKNGDTFDTFGTKKELGVLHEYLEHDEVVFALASGVMSQTDTSNSFDFGANTWLVALTSERFLFIDHAILSKSVDTQSVRMDRVQAVSSSQGWILGKISIDLGSRVIVVDNCQKKSVAIIADLANKWIRRIEQRVKERNGSTHSSGSGASDDLLNQLERLASLFSAGVLTQEEFSTAKAKLLL